jgi:copper(I)-binding protein
MKIKNADSADHSLINAHSAAAANVELHNHVMEDGMMKMRRQDTVELPQGETVVFEPGGLHIMLIGLTGPMNSGESVDIELEFEDGSRKRAVFDVR